MESDQARATALRLLARREHSRRELEQKLRSRGADPTQVEIMLDELGEQGLQSDRRYAEAFVRSRLGRRQGPVRIRGELKQRGVATTLIDAVIDEAEVDWLKHAVAALRKKQLDLHQLANQAKAQRFLGQRGFTGEHARQAIDQVLEEDTES